MGQGMTILEEAGKLVSGDRKKAYGAVDEAFAGYAAIWSALLKTKVTPRQVALCMIGLKLARDAHKAKRDNLVDICGYAAIAELLG